MKQKEDVPHCVRLTDREKVIIKKMIKSRFAINTSDAIRTSIYEYGVALKLVAE